MQKCKKWVEIVRKVVIFLQKKFQNRQEIILEIHLSVLSLPNFTKLSRLILLDHLLTAEVQKAKHTLNKGKRSLASFQVHKAPSNHLTN